MNKILRVYNEFSREPVTFSDLVQVRLDNNLGVYIESLRHIERFIENSNIKTIIKEMSKYGNDR